MSHWFDVDGAALSLSLWVAATSTAGAVCVGVPIALALERWRSRAKPVIEALILWPLVMPTTVLGYFLLVVLARDTALGRAFESVTGAPLLYTPRAATIAAFATALPLVVRATQRAFAAVDSSLLFAARSLGASEWHIARTLTVPLASRGIAAASLFAFARSLGEFGVTLVLISRSPSATTPASVAVFEAARAGQRSQAATLSVVLGALTFAAALVVQWLSAPRVSRATDERAPAQQPDTTTL